MIHSTIGIVHELTTSPGALGYILKIPGEGCYLIDPAKLSNQPTPTTQCRRPRLDAYGNVLRERNGDPITEPWMPPWTAAHIIGCFSRDAGGNLVLTSLNHSPSHGIFWTGLALNESIIHPNDGTERVLGTQWLESPSAARSPDVALIPDTTRDGLATGIFVQMELQTAPPNDPYWNLSVGGQARGNPTMWQAVARLAGGGTTPLNLTPRIPVAPPGAGGSLNLSDAGVTAGGDGLACAQKFHFHFRGDGPGPGSYPPRVGGGDAPE